MSINQYSFITTGDHVEYLSGLSAPPSVNCPLRGKKNDKLPNRLKGQSMSVQKQPASPPSDMDLYKCHKKAATVTIIAMDTRSGSSLLHRIIINY